jgi:hypothetical protein
MATIKCKCTLCGKSLVRKSAPSIKSKLHFCNNICKGEYQRTQKPATKEWLYEQYIVNKLNAVQIANIVDRDPKSVWTWLKDYGIPTRPRGKGLPAKENSSHLPSWKGKHHKKSTKELIRKIAIETGRVPYNKEIGPRNRGKYGSEASNWQGGITPERQAIYNSIEWADLVKKVWARDDGYCQLCNIRNTKQKRYLFHIHHIVPFRVKEKRMRLSNLILLCNDCHMWVHSKENKDKILRKEK